MSERRELDDALSALGDGLPAPPPPLCSELQREVDQMGACETRAPRRQWWMVASVSLLVGGLALVVMKVRADLGHLPVVWLAWYGLAWFLGFSVLLRLALVPRDGDVVPRARRAGLAGFATAGALIAMGLGFAEQAPGYSTALDGTLGQFASTAWMCLLAGHVIAFVPVAFGLRALRRAVPVAAGWVAAGLGAAGGALSGLVLHMHCPIADPMHVGWIHGGEIVVVAVVAAVIGPRLLRP